MVRLGFRLEVGLQLERTLALIIVFSGVGLEFRLIIAFVGLRLILPLMLELSIEVGLALPLQLGLAVMLALGLEMRVPLALVLRVGLA